MTNGYAAPHRGGLILALGILGLVVCAPAGIFAWILGKSDLAAIDGGSMDPTGRGSTQAGMICGIVATVLFGLQVVVLILVLVLFLTGSFDAALRS